MSKKFIIGDRLKDEWISVLDTEKKKLEFTNHLASAKAGDTLTAEAREVANHHKLPYVNVRITNQHGELCCIVTGLGYRKQATLPIDDLV